MDYNSRHKFSKPGQKPSMSSAGKKPPGFAGLDPAKLGLGMPDWLAPDSPTPAVPADAALAPATDALYAEPLPALPRETVADAAGESRTLLEGMKVVCICKGIKKRVFWKALDEGAQSKDEVNRVTGSGSGGCQGRRCGPRILEMLRDRFR
jgi:bacterioferritin-associated ferredoxin